MQRCDWTDGPTDLTNPAEVIRAVQAAEAGQTGLVRFKQVTPGPLGAAKRQDMSSVGDGLQVGAMNLWEV